MNTLKILLNFLIFRSCPSELPASPMWFWSIVALYVLVKMFGFWHYTLLWTFVLSIAAWKLIYIFILLKLKRFEARFIQTGMAIFGVMLVIFVLQFLLGYLTDNVNVLRLLSYVFSIWSLAIISHIFQRALSTRVGWAILATIGLLVTEWMVINLI